MDILADDHQGSDPLPPAGYISTIVGLDQNQSLSEATRAAAAALAADVNAADNATGIYRTSQPLSQSPLAPSLPPLLHQDLELQYDLPSFPPNMQNAFRAPFPSHTSTSATTAPTTRPPVRARPRSAPVSTVPQTRFRFPWETETMEAEPLLPLPFSSIPPNSVNLPSPPSSRHQSEPQEGEAHVATSGAPPLVSLVPDEPVHISIPRSSEAELLTSAASAPVAARPVESRKRKRTSPPEPALPAAPAASSAPSPRTENECQICMEPWNLSGEHQLCCLECGHLYGLKCIKTWLSKKKVCPSCKGKAKKKDIRLIFGAPVSLTVQDEGDLARLRADLQKEVADHVKTKRRLKDEKEKSASLARRFAAQNQSVHTFGHSATRQRQPRLSASRAQQLPQRTGPVMGGPPVASGGVQNATATARPSQPPRRVHVTQICGLPTKGASKALAFDDRGQVFFGEKRHDHQPDMGPQRIVRIPLANTAVRTTSRAELLGRVLDISICCDPTSNWHSYIAAANQVRKLHILSRDLEEVTTYSTPGIPLSCLWMESQPNLVIAGLNNGVVCAYDLRMAGSEALFQSTVQGSDHLAVHSLAEVPLLNTNHTMLLVASPSAINAASFGTFTGNMTLEQVHRGGPSQNELCCSMSVDGNQILLSTRQTNSLNGRHTIFPSLVSVASLSDGVNPMAVPESRSLHFARFRASLVGNRQKSLFEPTALVGGDGPSDDGMLVMSGDAVDAQRRTMAWEFSATSDRFTTPWTTAILGQVGTNSGSMTVRSRTLSPTQNVAHGGVRTRAVAGHLGDNFLQLFAVARRE